ncbi:MAG: YfhO family protein [Phycisphaerales bacterium]|nr:YfhO family protein [Phycisphaerales bacterium]
MDSRITFRPQGLRYSAYEFMSGPAFQKFLFLTVLLGGCYLAFYSPRVRGDDLQQHFAYYVHGFERLLRFEVPSWNPYVAAGMPWQAEHHHPFSPGMFLAYLVDHQTFIALHNVFMIMMAAVGMFAFVGRLGAPPAGAFVSAVVYVGSGVFAYALENGYSDHIAGMSYLPVISYCVLRVCERPRVGWSLWTGLALACFVCSSHYQLVYLGGLWLVPWALFCIFSRSREKFRGLAMLVCAVLVGLLLSAADWLPRLASTSLGAPTPRRVFGESVFYLSQLGNLGLPFEKLYKSMVCYGGPFTIVYVGSATMVMVALSLLRINRLVLFLLGFAVLAYLVSPGRDSILGVASYYYLPGFALFRKSERVACLFMLAFAILSGLGVGFLIEAGRRKWQNLRRIAVRGIILVVVVLLLQSVSHVLVDGYYEKWEDLDAFKKSRAWERLFLIESPEEPLARLSMYAGAAAFIAIPLLLLVRLMVTRSLLVVAIVTANAICFQLDHGVDYLPFRETFARKTQIREYIDSRKEHFRVATFPKKRLDRKMNERVPLVRGGSFPLGIEMYTGRYHTPSGFSLCKLPRFAEVTWHANRGDAKHFGQMFNTARYAFADPLSPFVHYYNVKYVISQSQLEADHLKAILYDERKREWLYENTDALPRAWLTTDYEVVSDRGKMLDRMGSEKLDPRKTVLLEQAPDLSPWDLPDDSVPKKEVSPEEAGEQSGMPSDFVGPSVKFLDYGEDRLRIAIKSPHRGFLVLSENYCDGWQATLDREPVQIYPAFVSLRAIPVPAGESIVAMSYRAPLLGLAVWTSAVSLIVVAVVGVYLFFARRAWRPTVAALRETLFTEDMSTGPLSNEACTLGLVAPSGKYGFVDYLFIVVLLGAGLIAHDWLYRSYPALNDFYYHMSVYKFTFDTILAGHVPHWNSFASCGIPNLAVPINHPFSPTLLICYVLDRDNYIHLHSMLWLAVACVSTYVLGRRFSRNRFGGLMAGCIYLLSGPMQFYTEGGNSHDFFVGICMLPLLLVVLERLFEKPSAVGIALGSLFVALMLTTAHLQASYYNLCVLAFWTVARMIGARPWRKEGFVEAARSGVMALFVLLLGIGISAMDWAPKYLYGDHAVPLIRSGGALGRYVRYMSLHPSVLNLLNELFVGVNRDWTVFYLGPIPLILAAAAFGAKSISWRLVFCLTLGVIVLLCLPGVYSPLFAWFYETVPGFSLFRKPTKMMYVVVLAFGLTGAMAMNPVLSFGREMFRRGRFVAALLVLCCLVLVAIPVGALGTAERARGVECPPLFELAGRIEPDMLLAATSIVAALVTTLLILFRRIRNPIRVAVLFAAVIVPAALVDSSAPKTVQSVRPSEAFAPASSVAQIIAGSQEDGRVAIAGFRANRPNWRYAPKAVPRGAENFFPYRSINDFSNYKTANFARMINVANGYKPEFRWGRHSSPAPIKLHDFKTALPDYLGIRYVVTNAEDVKEIAPGYEMVDDLPDGTKLLKNLNALPRFYLVSDPAVEPDLSVGLSELSKARSPGAARTFVTGSERAGTFEERPIVSDALEIRYERSGHIKLGVNSPEGGLVVIQEAYLPGWRAEVDGESVSIEMTNGLWCGIRIPAGSHEIDLKFVTEKFGWMTAASVAGLAVCLVLSIFSLRRRRKESVAIA